MQDIDPTSLAIGVMIGTFLTALVIDWHNEGVEGREDWRQQQEQQRKDSPEA